MHFLQDNVVYMKTKFLWSYIKNTSYLIIKIFFVNDMTKISKISNISYTSPKFNPRATVGRKGSETPILHICIYCFAREGTSKKSILHILCTRVVTKIFSKIFVIFQNEFLRVFSIFFHFKLDFLL